MTLEKIMFTKEPDSIFLDKPDHRFCKICMTPYLLHIPYEKANAPARDLCDDCIQNLDKDEINYLILDGKTDEVIQL